MADATLVLQEIVHVYGEGGTKLEVLRGANMAVSAGEVVALIGPSGSGKSTLLHIAGLLDRPHSGRVVIEGRDCGSLRERERTRLRRHEIGFVYQFHQLLPEFSALENVMLPQRIAGRRRREAGEEAERLLTLLGLGQRLEHRPSELSGGEQQRVAIARALANNPRVLLADEPTGNLDPKTAKLVFDEFLALVRREGLAALIATHNLDLATKMDRAVLLHDGRLIDGRELAARPG